MLPAITLHMYAKKTRKKRTVLGSKEEEEEDCRGRGEFQTPM